MRNIHYITCRFAIVSAFLLLPCLAAAQSTAVPAALPGTPATILQSADPEYPAEEQRRQRQGWVKVGFVVTTNGTTADPIIEDSSGSWHFERSALKAVSGMLFEPATIDGEPVEQYVTDTMITFSNGDSGSTMSGAFNRRYRDISRILAASDFNLAGRLINDTFQKFSLNLADLARLWMLRGMHAQGVGDGALQLAAFRKALANDGAWINANSYGKLMTVVVSLELSAGDYSSALNHYVSLVDRAGSDAIPSNIQRAFDTAHRQLATAEILAVPARLGEPRQ